MRSAPGVTSAESLRLALHETRAKAWSRGHTAPVWNWSTDVVHARLV